MKKPVIGITPDYSQEKTYSKYPWYALREHYSKSLSNLATVIILPYHQDSLDNYLSLLDGCIITGGDFDIDPSWYGQQQIGSRNFIPKRSNFEKELFTKAYGKKIPILGICGGAQLINVVLGGNLIQDLSTQYSNAIEHEQPTPRDQAYHKVYIEKDTKLYKIAGNIMKVNSAHHQAIANLGKDLKVSSRAQDGVIESFESKVHPFCWGIQWHPEFLIDAGDTLIFEQLVYESQQYARKSTTSI